MTADTIAAWDGFPKSPKMDGWHWLSNNADTFAAFWVADDELSAWMTPIGDDALLPEQIKEWRYLGPCLTPNQVAALLAERNKLNEYYKDALEAVVDLTAERDAARAEALRLREALSSRPTAAMLRAAIVDPTDENESLYDRIWRAMGRVVAGEAPR